MNLLPFLTFAGATLGVLGFACYTWLSHSRFERQWEKLQQSGERLDEEARNRSLRRESFSLACAFIGFGAFFAGGMIILSMNVSPTDDSNWDTDWERWEHRTDTEQLRSAEVRISEPEFHELVMRPEWRAADIDTIRSRCPQSRREAAWRAFYSTGIDPRSEMLQPWRSWLLVEPDRQSRDRYWPDFSQPEFAPQRAFADALLSYDIAEVHSLLPSRGSENDLEALYEVYTFAVAAIATLEAADKAVDGGPDLLQLCSAAQAEA